MFDRFCNRLAAGAAACLGMALLLTPIPVQAQAQALNRSSIIFLKPETSNRATGTAFMIGSTGYALTAYHVVKGWDDQTLLTREQNPMRGNPGSNKWNGRYVNFGISQKEPDHDIALLRVLDYDATLPVLQVCRPPRDLAGREVTIVGFPGGLSYQPVNGTIGDMATASGYAIDAPIKAGMSGAPVIDKKTGKVIGVATGAFGNGVTYRFISIEAIAHHLLSSVQIALENCDDNAPPDDGSPVGTMVQRCDALAASPLDERAPWPGVDFSKLIANSDKALQACADAAALADSPPRVAAQYGRVLQATGDYDGAVRQYLVAAAAQHAIAENNLGTIYTNRTSSIGSNIDPIYWLKRAEESGLALAALNLFGHYLNDNRACEAAHLYMKWKRQGHDIATQLSDQYFILSIAEGCGVSLMVESTKLTASDLALHNGDCPGFLMRSTPMIARFAQTGNRQGRATLHFDRARCHHSMGQTAEARRNLHEAILMNNDYGDALNMLGYLMLTEDGASSDARGYIEHAVRTAPSNPEYLDSLGLAYLKENQPQRALPHLVDAFRDIDFDRGIVALNLGDAHAALQQHDDAREVWQAGLNAFDLQPATEQDLRGRLGMQ